MDSWLLRGSSLLREGVSGCVLEKGFKLRRLSGYLKILAGRTSTANVVDNIKMWCWTC